MKAEDATEMSRASYLSEQRHKPEDYKFPLRSLASKVTVHISKEFQNPCYETTKKKKLA